MKILELIDELGDILIKHGDIDINIIDVIGKDYDIGCVGVNTKTEIVDITLKLKKRRDN